MPVSHEHLNENTRVWDGIGFKMIPTKEAKKLESEGHVQITQNLTAAELLTRDQLKEQAKAKKPKKTRQMKPQSSGGKGYQTKVITPDECSD